MTGTRKRFADLHRAGTFVIPNPWDIGSALVLQSMGCQALATTSSGLAAAWGLPDQHLTRDRLLEHVAALTAAVELPVSVDSERGYADTVAGVAETVRLLAEAGAAGCSIEDYDPASGAVEPIGAAAERVGAAAEEAHRHDLVLTGRAEAHLYGPADLDDTIGRLRAYRDAGADVVYAPGLTALADIEQVVRAVGCPVNVLAHPAGPSVPELAGVGVRRVSTGGALAWAAYGALHSAAAELLEQGTSTYTARSLTPDQRAAAFG